jgi:hypothetical protein
MRIVALCFLVRPMRRNFSIPKLPDPQIFTNRKEADSRTDSAQEAQKKERVARCQPEADHVAQIRKDILAIQQ